jgi:hypothetical protein
MNKLLTSTLLAATLLSSVSAIADVLTLKDGQTLTGTLVSRSAEGVVFEIGGQQMKFASANVQNISFGDAAPAPVQAQAPQTAPQAQSTQAVAPAGTRVVVRTSTAIDSKKHNAGHKFTVRLEADLVANNMVIAPRGSTLYGVVAQAKQSGRAVGSSSLEITFTDIMLNNQMKPIATSSVKAVTESTTKSTVGKSARLAAVGGLANGSKGAKNAAKFSLGASLLTSGNSINIPAGTLLEFQLAMPLAK